MKPLCRMVGVLAMASSGLLGPALVRAQASGPDDVIEHKPVLLLSIRLADGQFEASHFFAGGWNDRSDALSLLRHKAVREELELADDQGKSLDQFIENTNRSMQEWKRAHGFPATTAESRQQLEALRRQMEMELNARLLPHQQVALAQLAVRFKFRREGLVQSLTKREIRERLEISDEQVGELLRISGTAAEEYGARIDALKKELATEFFGLLTAAQREELGILGEDFVARRLPPLSAMGWQMENIDRLHKEAKAWPSSRFAGLLIATSFTVDVDGNLIEFNEFHSRGVPARQPDKQPRVWYMFNSLLGYLQQDWLADELALSADQRSALTHLAEENDEFNMSLLERRKDLRGDALRAMNDVNRQEADEFGRAGLVQLDEILLPQQAQLLERISECAELVKGGIGYAMLHGNLGTRLAVTAEQKKQFQDLARRWVASIERETRKWEQEFIDTILGALSDKQRELLQQMMGPDLKHAKANLDLMLAQVRQW